jgi:predicted transposase YbfD/YdcC
MPCTPKKTVQRLRDAGAHGLFAAKLNQPSLLKACQRRSRFPVTDTHRSVEKPHGTVVERVTQIWAFRSKDLPVRWRGDFTTTIRTRRITHHRHKKPTTETVFHVTTTPVTAEQAAGLIRQHWAIENSWHHLRDVGFTEDASTATGLTARGLSLLRTWSINLARYRRTEPHKAQREQWHDPRLLFAWWSQ